MAYSMPGTSKTYLQLSNKFNTEESDEDNIQDSNVAENDDIIQRIIDDSSDDNISDILGSDEEGEQEQDITEQEITAPTWSSTTGGMSGMKPIAFTKTPGLLVPVPGEGQPIDFLNLVLDDVLLENMCRFSNKYAFEIFSKYSLQPHSRINKWKELKVPELKHFLGLLFHTGTIRLSRLQDYWKTDPLFDFKCFSKVMSRDRFLSILRCLHFYSGNPDSDPLDKVRYFVDYFNTKMKSIYYPEKEMSLDEAMVLWRGRLHFRQYIKSKRHKYGVKLYTLTEHQGFILKFLIYAGSKDPMVGGKGHTEKVVMYLLKDYLNQGHSVYMDNFYNSFSLASKLLSQNTYCTGTLRIDRKHNPIEVKSAVLQKGETIARYGESVMVGKWRDKRVVNYISTEFENTMIDFIDKRNNIKKKPLPIVKYNCHMSGVDRADQLLSYYPFERKSLRWYERVSIHILQMLLLNSHALYNMYMPTRLTFYDFRLDVIRKLLPPIIKPVESPAQKRLRQSVHKIGKITERNASNRIRRKTCRVCWKNKKDVKSSYICETCEDKPGLCFGGCFDKYHDSM